MLSNQKDLPSWTTFPLKNFKKKISLAGSVVMGDHVVVLVQDNSQHPEEREKVGYGSDDEYDSDEDEPATLLAFSLKDHTVREAEIDTSPFIYQKSEYSFLRYGENQIIKYDGGSAYDPNEAESMICITVKSFKRII